MSKDKLKSMLDNMIDGKSEQAQVDFHDYLQDKMKATINPQEVEVEVDDDVDVEDETE